MPTADRKPPVARGPKQQPTLTAEQITRLQPFRAKLLRRYREVAAQGYTDLPDPLCAKVHNDKHETCCDCPVYGMPLPPPKRCISKNTGKPYMRDSEFVHCAEFMPPRPRFVDDTPLAVTVNREKKGAEERVAAAKAWGQRVVDWIEGLGL